MAELVYDNWFVQYEFPDESGHPYKSYLGDMVWNDNLQKEIPAGWSSAPLSKCIASVNEDKSLGDILLGYKFLLDGCHVIRSIPCNNKWNDPALLSIRPNYKIITSNYLYQVLRSYEFIYKAEYTCSKGLETQFCKRSDLLPIKSIQVLIPPNRVLQAFDEIVEPMYQKILNSFNGNQNLAELRDTVLSELNSLDQILDDLNKLNRSHN